MQLLCKIKASFWSGYMWHHAQTVGNRQVPPYVPWPSGIEFGALLSLPWHPATPCEDGRRVVPSNCAMRFRLVVCSRRLLRQFVLLGPVDTLLGKRPLVLSFDSWCLAPLPSSGGKCGTLTTYFMASADYCRDCLTCVLQQAVPLRGTVARCGVSSATGASARVTACALWTGPGSDGVS